MYLNLNAPSNYQLQGFGQNGVRTISTDQLYIQGEYYRVLVAEEDSYVTAVSVLGDDLTAEFVYAGTTIYGLFTEVSVTSGSLTAYIAGPTDIEDVWAYINAYGQTNAATIEAADCAKDAIAPLLDKYYAKASLVMVPSLYKTSIVYSERPLTTAGQLAFTRSNDTATRVGPDGYIEKVRTNLITYSEDMVTDKVAVNTTVTNDFTTAPDGTTTAAKLENTAIASHLRTSITTFSLSTFSFYAKYESNQFVQAINAADVDCFVNFDIQNGVIGTAGAKALYPQIESVGSGWYRCSVYFNTTSVGSYRLYMVSSLTSGYTSASVTVGSVYYTWGWQIETGDIATDYIPTTTAAVSVGPVANLPRLNYPINNDGSVGCPSLLLEPQRTNLAIYSEQFDNAAWTKGNITVTPNVETSPDGYTNADKIVGTVDIPDLRTTSSIPITSGISYTWSAYVKNAGYKYVRLTAWTSDDPVTIFDLDAISVVSESGPAHTSTIEDVGNGWRKITITRTSASVLAWFRCVPLANATGTIAQNGVDGIYLWGAQLEAGSYATSYIPTLGAAVTRGADAASKTGIASLIGQSEGTMFIEMASLTDSVVSNYFSISDGTYSNRASILFSTGTNFIRSFLRVNSISQFDRTAVGVNITEMNKIAFAYSENDFAMYINGVLIQQSNAGDTFNPNTLSVVSFSEIGSGLGQLNANVSQALLFPTRLTNQELQDLTTL